MKRIFGLDLLRIYAITLVVVFHGRDEGMPEWIHATFYHGYIGVDVFFTLSAWLVAKPLVRDYAKGKLDIGSFWIMRWGKTIPPFLAVIFLVGILEHLGVRGLEAPKPDQWFTVLTFRANYLGDDTPYPVIWSLAVEEQFYLFLPLCLLLLMQFPARVSLLFGLALLVMPISLRFFHLSDTGRTLTNCLDGFAVGTLLVFAKEYNTLFWQTLVRRRKFYAAVGALIVGSMQFLPVRHEGFFAAVLAGIVTPLGVGFMLPWLDSLNPTKRWITWPIETMAKGTYAIYLTHSMAIAFAYRLPLQPGWGRFWIMIGLTGLFSFILYRGVEVPISERRKQVVLFFRRFQGSAVPDVSR